MNTIIILLILAGVSISLLAGGNGILKKATDAVDFNTEATAKEEIELKVAETLIDYYDDVYVNKTYSVNTVKRDYIEEKIPTGTTNSGYEFTISGGTVTVIATDNNGLSADLIGSMDEKGIIIWENSNDGVGGNPSEDESTATPEPLIDKITAANYGDLVTYSANGITDWKIFYNDGENVFIIPSDYVNHTTITNKTAFSNAGMSTTEKCVAYWETVPSTIQTGWDTHKDKYIMKYYNSAWIQNNFKCVATLLNTDNWTDFVNSAYAEWAIGGPTLEMYVASWNAKGYTSLYCNKTDSEGYFLGTENSPETTSVNMKSDTDGYGDELYYPHAGSSTYNNCCGYWLASTNAEHYRYVGGVYYHGIVGGDDYKSLLAVRPVVMLNSNVKATSSTSKGITTWKLSK